MQNIDVIDKLIENFLKSDPKVIARLAANLIVDIDRIVHIKDFSQEEKNSIFVRLNLNSQSLHKFLKDGQDDEGVTLHQF